MHQRTAIVIAAAWMLAAASLAEEQKAKGKLTRLGKLPAEIVESSGLTRGPAAGTFITHNDSQSARRPMLYLIRENGELVRRLEVPAGKQRDWEAVAVDDRGRVYVCDCGNNASDRRDLVIYRLDLKKPDKSGAIAFVYPDQREFPPKDKQQCFDVEAVICLDQHLYLFTKDRPRGRASKVYRLKADGPNRQTAELLGELEVDGAVTDAAVSPKGDLLVLLGREKLFLSPLKKGDLLGARFEKHKLDGAGQTEGVTFLDDARLLITNEQGDVFRYDLP
jgi:hypothetical protein